MTRPNKRTAAATAGLVLGALVLTGCGVGLDAQTYEARNQGTASNVNAGDLAIRNVYVEAPQDASGYAAGSDATLVLAVASRKDAADALVSASSPAATSITIPDGRVVVPAAGRVLDVRLTLMGLTAPLRSTAFILVTLTFASGQTAQVNTPVATTNEPPEQRPGYEVGKTDSNGDPLPEHSVPLDDTPGSTEPGGGAVESG